MELVFLTVRGALRGGCQEHRAGLDCHKGSVQGSEIPGRPFLAQAVALGDEIVLFEGIGGFRAVPRDARGRFRTAADC